MKSLQYKCPRAMHCELVNTKRGFFIHWDCNINIGNGLLVSIKYSVFNLLLISCCTNVFGKVTGELAAYGRVALPLTSMGAV